MDKRTRIMGRRKRIGIGGHGGLEEDPMGGLTNLFDVAMVFAVALMLALVTYSSLPELISGKNVTLVKNPGTADMEIITKQGEKVEIQKVTNETIRQETGNDIYAGKWRGDLCAGKLSVIIFTYF